MGEHVAEPSAALCPHRVQKRLGFGRFLFAGVARADSEGATLSDAIVGDSVHVTSRRRPSEGRSVRDFETLGGPEGARAMA